MGRSERQGGGGYRKVELHFLLFYNPRNHSWDGDKGRYHAPL